MILTCPACSTRYHAVDDSVGSKARRVRCAKCGHEWVFDPIQGVTTPDRAGLPPEPEELTVEGERPPSEPRRPAQAMKSAMPSFATAADSGAGGAIYIPRRPRRLDLILSVFIALAILAAVMGGLWKYRIAIVRSFPALGGLYDIVGVHVNAVGMEIRGTKWRIEDHGGVPVLAVSGEVANISKKTLPVPHLALSLRDGSGHELYHWSVVLKRKQLAPGGTTQFSTTLASPPLEAHDVQIRFASTK